MCTPPFPPFYASTQKIALYLPYIHRYKCSIICIDFSLLKYLVKEAWLFQKEKREHMKVPAVKKSGHMKVH
jgi:hypothetical protein